MKAVVTGANGFVGRHLVEHLRAEGDEVIGVDRATDPAVDVTDAAGVRDVLVDVHPDAVYHLAALSHVGESWDEPAKCLHVNVEGTMNVLVAARDAGASRVLVVGSADEYGSVEPDEVPLREDAPLKPVTPYGASKVAAEFVALQAFLGERLPTIRVRAFNHTGPGQSDRFVVPALAGRLAEAERSGQHEIRTGSLDAVRDLSDVRDVVRAYRLLVEHGIPGDVYNVCSGESVSIREIADRLLASSPAAIGLRVDPSLVRGVEVPQLVGDPTKLRKATGWQPEIDLDHTLADVLALAREAR